MKNPFKPSDIVSEPNEFYGRAQEIRTLSRFMSQGSIAIQGTFGVGKSSLLSRTLLHMDGFDSKESSTYKIVVGHGDINTIEDAARLVLEELVDIDSTSKTLTVGIPKLAQYSSTEAYTLFQEGRHLAALNKILEDKAFKEYVSNGGYFIIGIDESEKCAPAIARLFRQILTKSQLSGISNIRFVFAGVSHFVQQMIAEDNGVMRFIYETIELKPFSQEEARDFLDDKFKEVVESAKKTESPVNMDPDVIDRIVQLSGGHPHLLQLLGSHVVEHEFLNPDGVIDNEDLVGSLEKICYQKRAPAYDSLIHDMKAEGYYDAYLTLLEMMGGKFPGKHDVKKTLSSIDKEDMDWLLSRNVVIVSSDDDYELADELLRVRVLMDRFEDYSTLEMELIEHGEILKEGQIFDQIWNSP
jgi:AAA+ ATPase superfamily predicted ATPase